MNINCSIRRLLCFVWLFAAIPFSVSAAALITEIMYDAPGTDSGREWIEIQNTGDTPVDLSTWKLFEANVNHKIVVVGDGTTGVPSIPAGGFAIIADSPDKFKADNPMFTGLLLDSAFSLSNAGETLILRDESGADIDTVSYLPDWGAVGDGNSLQKSAVGTWISAPVTAGLPTTATETAMVTVPEAGAAEPDPDEVGAPDNASEDLSVHSGQQPANTSVSKPEFEITIGRPRIGFVGSPIFFEARIALAKNMPMGLGIRSMWAMGDGTELFGQFISHAYEFAGDYIVVANVDSGSMHATSKTFVKIIEPELRLAVLNDGSIEIKNLSKGEINIGWFILEDADKRFIIPRDTIIPASGSVKLPTKVTGIVSPRDFVRIASPSGKVFSTVTITTNDPLIILPEGSDFESLRNRLIEAFK